MSSLSEITDDFTKLVTALRDYADATYRGLEWTAAPEWFAPKPPAEGGPQTIDLRDPASIAAAFDRSQVHDLMLKILAQTEVDAPADALNPVNVQASQPQGAAMDLSVIQSQLEFMQAVERSYFCATANYCRTAAHAAARHEGHAVTGGVLDRGIATAIANMKKRAAGRSTV